MVETKPIISLDVINNLLPNMYINVLDQNPMNTDNTHKLMSGSISNIRISFQIRWCVAADLNVFLQGTLEK